MSSSTLPSKITRKKTVTLIVIAALAVFIAVSALPRYVSSWPWATPLKVPNQSELQAIRDQGLSLEGWQTDEQVRTKIGGDAWSIQQLSPLVDKADSTPIFLLLRPQVWEADQPEVEWLDLKGSQRWQTDSHKKLGLNVAIDTISDPSASLQDDTNSQNDTNSVRITTDFFRAWSQDQTYAVLQWYAWPTGGSPSPAGWFWADQQLQWRQRKRMPWVAVSLWLPIAPLGEISSHESLATALADSVQETLSKTVFPKLAQTTDGYRIASSFMSPFTSSFMNQKRGDDDVLT